MHPGLRGDKVNMLNYPYIPTQTPEEDKMSPCMCSHQADSQLYVWPDVWSGDLQVQKTMVTHDTECPYWDQMSLTIAKAICDFHKFKTGVGPYSVQMVVRVRDSAVHSNNIKSVWHQPGHQAIFTAVLVTYAVSNQFCCCFLSFHGVNIIHSHCTKHILTMYLAQTHSWSTDLFEFWQYQISPLGGALVRRLGAHCMDNISVCS